MAGHRKIMKTAKLEALLTADESQSNKLWQGSWEGLTKYFETFERHWHDFKGRMMGAALTN